MFSIYAVTDQGQRTRSQLMTVLSHETWFDQHRQDGERSRCANWQ